MRKDEQLDAYTFVIENLIDDTITLLDKSDDENIIGNFLRQLNYHINHHLEEFDINVYEAIGILEDVKYTMLLEGEAVPNIIGCLDAQKIAMLTQDQVSFDCEMDDDDFYMD